MNRSHCEHALIALVMQAIFGLLTGNWWIGAAFGAAFFLGREHAQAEERYIEANGGSRRHTPVAPEWAVFHPKWWGRDALLDWMAPTAAVLVVAVCFSMY